MTDQSDSATASMAPMEYFPHDSDAARDTKCRRLIRRQGWAAYGRWMRVCELLARERGHHIPFETEEDVALLADELGFGPEKCQAFVGELADVGLVDAEQLAEGHTVYSGRMGRNAFGVGSRRAAGLASARARKGA